MQQALAEWSGLDIARIAQRMLGEWVPSPALLGQLLSPDELPLDRQQPYPFFLASPLEGDPAERLGPIEDWLLEWKWDGIRLQRCRGEVALWSRGEERLDGRFPEIEQAAMALPDGCVLDGELLAWDEATDLPRAFTALQTRIQRRKPGAATLRNTPGACSPMTCWNTMARTCVSCRCGNGVHGLPTSSVPWAMHGSSSHPTLPPKTGRRRRRCAMWHANVAWKG